MPLRLSYGNFFPLVKRQRYTLAKRWKIRLFICYFETITSDIIMISFYQHRTKVQDHRHWPCSFPNFKEIRLFVVSLDHIGGIWLDTNTHHKSHFYESKQLWKYFSTCLMKQLLNQQKIAVMIQLWLKKWLSENNIFSQQFYSLNELTVCWVLQKTRRFYYCTLFISTAASAQVWETGSNNYYHLKF